MSEPVKGRCICEHDRSRHEAGAQECRVGACHCPFFRQEDEISIGLREGTLRFVSEDESGGQQQAAAPKAPLDPKVGQMSEDAKAFGPAAHPSDGRCAVMLRCMRPVCHDGGHEYTSPPEPVVTREELRKLLDDAVPGAEELGRSLKRVFRLPDDDLRLDSASASGGAKGAAPKEPTSGNAEGAKALEIARAEGKAEAWTAVGVVLLTSSDVNTAIRRIRSLIPAAPGGGGGSK